MVDQAGGASTSQLFTFPVVGSGGISPSAFETRGQAVLQPLSCSVSQSGNCVGRFAVFGVLVVPQAGLCGVAPAVPGMPVVPQFK